MLIGVTVASVMSNETTGTVTEQDIDQMTNEIIDEISTLLQIKDAKGKYYNINGERKITQILLLVSEWVSQDIDLNQSLIQIDNGETVRILSYSGMVSNLDSSPLFDHTIWENLNGENFGLVVIRDRDSSIIDYHTLNENTDMVYVLIRLPDDMTISKYDEIYITIINPVGTLQRMRFEVPFSTKNVITLE
jgi:archaellin